MPEAPEWLSLTEGEAVVWTGQPRRWRIVPAVARSAVWGLVFVFVAVVGPRFAPPSIPGIVVTGVALLVALASLKPGVTAYLQTTNVDYVLTTRNVYKKVGVWSTNVTRIAVADVQNSQLRKDFWGNRFDYGNVAVSTAGSKGTDLLVTDLERPETFRDELQRIANETKDRSPDIDAQIAGLLDARTVEQVTENVRAIRETAERLETEMSTE